MPTRTVLLRDGAVGAVNGLGVGLLLDLLSSQGAATIVLVGSSCAAGAIVAGALGVVFEASAR